jgi:hypothetical protein
MKTFLNPTYAKSSTYSRLLVYLPACCMCLVLPTINLELYIVATRSSRRSSKCPLLITLVTASKPSPETLNTYNIS